MASSGNGSPPGRRRRSSSVLVLNEGYLAKRSEFLKTWTKRYCVLNPQCLCYFKSEKHTSDEDPIGRVFLDDIIETESNPVVKRKLFCFTLHVDTGNKRKSIIFHASTEQERVDWLEYINKAKEKEKKAERDDPFRKTLKKLTKGLKRVRLEKDENKGIGCTIKNAAGLILVSRILEDGPIAATGVLKPGDELLDLHGISVTGKTIDDVVQILRECPDEFIATVKPIVSVRRHIDPRMIDEKSEHKTLYSKLVFPPPGDLEELVSTPSSELAVTPTSEDLKTPPVPPQTDNALIPISPSTPPIPPRTEASLMLLESCRNQSNHDDTFKFNGNKMDTTSSSQVVRRPHYYDEIVISPKSGKGKLANGNSDQPTNPLAYADIDFRERNK